MFKKTYVSFAANSRVESSLSSEESSWEWVVQARQLTGPSSYINKDWIERILKYSAKITTAIVVYDSAKLIKTLATLPFKFLNEALRSKVKTAWKIVYFK